MTWTNTCFYKFPTKAAYDAMAKPQDDALAAIDVVGRLMTGVQVDAFGVVINAGVLGVEYHVNIRWNGEEPQAWKAYAINPATPRRDFA